MIANLKMLVRNRQALFWAMVFPLIFVGAFGLFDLDNLVRYQVGVLDNANDGVSRRIVEGLRAIDNIDLDVRHDEAQARHDVADGDLEFLVVIPKGLGQEVQDNAPARVELIYDETSPKASSGTALVQRFLDQVNLQLAQAPRAVGVTTQGVRGLETDYFDFLLPGFVGMGVMTFSIIGLAGTLALYRQMNIFKRILATPLKVRTFFSGLVLAYLVLALVQATVILAVGVLVLGGNVHGNLLYLAVPIVLSNLIFVCIGFIVGAYSKTVAAASGLGNAVVLPLVFLSGTFFRADSLPTALRGLSKALPLSPMLEVMRGISLDAKPIWDFPLEIGLMVAWIALLGAVAVRVFRFQS